MVLQQHNQNKTLYIYSPLKTASVCTKTTIKSAPLHAVGGGRGRRGRAEGGEEVGAEGEGEAARRSEEVAGEGKSVASGAEPAPVLRFGTAAAGGKKRAAGGGTTEGGGRGER